MDQDYKAYKDYKDYLCSIVNELKQNVEKDIDDLHAWQLDENRSRRFEQYRETTDDEKKEIIAAKNKQLRKINLAVKGLYKDVATAFPKDVRERPFPRDWMLDDPRIKEVLKRFEYLCPIMNFIFHYNKRIRGEEYDKMVVLADRLTNKEKYNGHDFSLISVNRIFYDKITKAVKLGEDAIGKYLKELCNRNILNKVGRDFNNNSRAMCYLDGYFVKDAQGYHQKYSFLKETKEWKEELRNFDINS